MTSLRHSHRYRAAASGFFPETTCSFGEIEDRLRASLARGEIDRTEAGDLFEVFCEALLRLHHLFGAFDVWPVGSIPSEHLAALNIPRRDRGIDGVYADADGGLVAYQAKFRSDGGRIAWRPLGTFVGLAENAARRLVITNASGIATDASDRRGVFAMLGHELRALPEDMIRRACDLIRGQEPRPPERLAPKPHQEAAIGAAVAEFAEADRCTLIMACGSGKTLTALWAAERLRPAAGDAKILVLLPSLALVRQMLEAWTLRNSWGDAFRFLCVCSDESVTERDDVVVRQEDVPFPVTTSPAAIREFLAGGGMRVVFSTYQSADKVAAAAGGVRFDLGVFDEAHRTARGVDTEFALPLGDDNISIAKRLFMTATRRVFSLALRERAPLASMDDTRIYGRIAYSLNFRQAADIDVICRPKVIVSVVTGAELRAALDEAGVRVAGGSFALRDVAGRYALALAMKRLGLKKAFTFHGTVARAKEFVDGERIGVQAFLPGFKCLHVSGAMPTSEREDIMGEFARAERGVVSNARCLNEGVDVPAVDLVAFMDPKKSLIDIVQAIGRAVRKASGKTFGYVLLPVFIDADRLGDVGGEVSRTEFQDVWRVLRALMDQDAQLTQTINSLRVMSRGGRVIDGGALEEFVAVLCADGAETALRYGVTVAVVERLGDAARMDCRPVGPLVQITDVDRVVGALSERFGKRLIPSRNGKILTSEDGTMRMRLSCCNGYYEHEGAYFNQVKPSDFEMDFYVTWSGYTDFGFAIPCDRLKRYLESINATSKRNGTFLDWNPVTYFDDQNAYMMMRNTPFDVSSFRVAF